MDILQLGELAAIGTAFLWTLSALAWTSAGKDMGALAMSFIRLIVTAAYLSIYGLLFRRGAVLPLDADGNTWLLLTTSGFFGFFIADVCLFKSFLLIGPRLSLLLQSLSPPLSAIIARVFMSDKLLPKDWLGMAITLAGVVWVVLERPETPEEHRRRRHIARGIFFALIAAVSGAVGLVFSKKGIGQYDAAAATYIRVIGAMAGYAVLLTLVWRWPVVFRAARHTKAMGILMFGSFVGPFLGVILCMISLRYCHAGVVSTIINTMPVIILPFLIVIYHEKVSIRAFGGALLSVLGVAVLVL
jgi:drug/metabolite transporter (DMT)-like permease